jgi:hypothetical protein
MHLVTCDSIDYNRFIGMFVLPAKVGISQDSVTWKKQQAFAILQVHFAQTIGVIFLSRGARISLVKS